MNVIKAVDLSYHLSSSPTIIFYSPDDTKGSRWSKRLQPHFDRALETARASGAAQDITKDVQTRVRSGEFKDAFNDKPVKAVTFDSIEQACRFLADMRIGMENTSTLYHTQSVGFGQNMSPEHQKFEITLELCDMNDEDTNLGEAAHDEEIDITIELDNDQSQAPLPARSLS